MELFLEEHNKNIKSNVDSIIGYNPTKQEFEKEIQTRVDEIIKISKDFKKDIFYSHYLTLYHNPYFYTYPIA